MKRRITWWFETRTPNGVLGDTLSQRRIASVEMCSDRTEVGSRRQLGYSANLPSVSHPTGNCVGNELTEEPIRWTEAWWWRAAHTVCGLCREVDRMENGSGGPQLFKQPQKSVAELLLQVLVEVGAGDPFALLPSQPLEMLLPGFQRWKFQRDPTGAGLTENDTVEGDGRIVHDGDGRVGGEWFIGSGRSRSDGECHATHRLRWFLSRDCL